jgi:hypothetical protein
MNYEIFETQRINLCLILIVGTVYLRIAVFPYGYCHIGMIKIIAVLIKSVNNIV